MALNDLVYWYQKKIGTYDKQQWEKTVEQKISSGYTHVPMRTAKLKTEFIDVDLVRGSSFPKAKPKHGLGTVAYFAVQRLLFLPFHAQWWIQQTSLRIYILFLLLYGLQMLNIYIYFYHIPKDNESDVVSTSEILIPAVMMLTLCLVHSQIVSTNSGPIISSKYEKQVQRSRHGRSRLNKSKNRRNMHDKSDSKTSEETNPDKISVINNEVSPSVRFSSKVTVKMSTVVTETSKAIGNCNSSEKNNDNGTIACPKSYAKIKGSEVENQIVLVDNSQKNGENKSQDDDGFESLNGNVSSDNDRDVLHGKNEDNQVKTLNNEIEKQENETTKENLQCDISAPEISKKRENYNDSEDDCDSPSSEHPSVQSSRDDGKLCESEEEGECEDIISNHLMDATTSATEWMGVTTNSDECSYSSELEESDCQSEVYEKTEFVENPFPWEFELPPSILLSTNCGSSDRVSCTIWTHRDIKKAELSVLDISSAIIAKVESMPESMDYFYAGLFLAVLLSLVPSLRRVCDHYAMDSMNNSTVSSLAPSEVSLVNSEALSDTICKLINVAFGSTLLDRIMILSSAFERLVLGSLLYFLLAVAERTYKQRLLIAKLFSHLTSSRRARESDLPHFRLNKVRNIKSWLSVRSYLKRRGPQRSVDIIVSSVFIITLALLSFVSMELIKDLDSLHSHYNIEALLWSFSLGIFILRFMTLGTKINKKYRNLSVLITEQINLYLQIEQKSHKKEELMVANSVLKLAADLIKELESPFKISGLSANPYLYTITKVVLLSALSGVLSELLGFKLKLHKIKIK